MNQLITDCLQELATNEEARDIVNKALSKAGFDKRPYDSGWDVFLEEGCFSKYEFHFLSETDEFEYVGLEELTIMQQVFIIQTLLSRPNGQPVMTFLDVETEPDILPSSYPLDELLFHDFVEALRTGKTLEEALEIINEIYLKYANK